jgi:hypothetical protein
LTAVDMPSSRVSFIHYLLHLLRKHYDIHPECPLYILVLVLVSIELCSISVVHYST